MGGVMRRERQVPEEDHDPSPEPDPQESRIDDEDNLDEWDDSFEVTFQKIIRRRSAERDRALRRKRGRESRKK